ncbi:hypothetical protein BKA66DRAFT_239295 [Pyrenochaeta sp. MPI-SDFR-AT-0127]|nr:hypothetical protein BKA66DRAFT_239295 [Pyrenochaeta sp. MPI-SDFR-AT-0127]
MVTTSAASTTVTTSITRLITTQTITETATTILPPVLARAANIAAVAEDIIDSVIASGTTQATTTSKNWQRVVAEAGLANACSCKMVDPTATVTSSFALPPVYSTVGYRKLVLLRTTDTKSFTAYTTVTLAPTPSILTSSGLASASTTSSSSQLTASLSSTNLLDISVTSTSSGAQGLASASSENILSSSTAITSEFTTTYETPTPQITGPVSSVANSSSTSIPVVTAIPFSCPDAIDKRVDQIVGDFRLDYLVLCNTELITRDRIGSPIAVESETSCAAQCSLVNAQSGQDTCQAASFEPFTDGRRGGTCTLSASETEYVDKPGSVAIVHTGTSSNGNECSNLNATTNTSSPIDTSALIATRVAMYIGSGMPSRHRLVSGGRCTRLHGSVRPASPELLCNNPRSRSQSQPC